MCPETQVEIYQRLIEIARKRVPDARTLVIDAIQREIDRMTTFLPLDLQPTKPVVDVAAKFSEFKQAYPKRKGSQMWPKAQELFTDAVKRGTNPDDIIEGARRFAGAERESVGTCYIPQAVKWVRNKGWREYTNADSPPRNVDPKEARRLQAIEELRGIL